MGIRSGDPFPTITPQAPKVVPEPNEQRLDELEKKIKHIEKYLEDVTASKAAPPAKGKGR